MSYATIIWILSRIDIVLHDYPATHNTLNDVIDVISKQLNSEGYTVSAIGRGKITVNGEPFRIYKPKGWNHFEVRNLSA